jgi:hypothetical protein
MCFLFYLYLFNRRRRKRASHCLWINNALIAWTLTSCTPATVVVEKGITGNAKLTPTVSFIYCYKK